MRCFLALDFGDAVKRELANLQRRLGGSCPGVRWTEPAQLHLTLKFLGEIDDQQVVDVSAALKELTALMNEFDVTVSGVGALPPGGGPLRIVYVGLCDDTGSLARLHSECEKAMEALGFPRENRAFRPHLTLGRVKDARDARGIREALQRHASFTAGEDTINHVTFYESILRPSGPSYTPLSRHAFAGR